MRPRAHRLLVTAMVTLSLGTLAPVIARADAGVGISSPSDRLLDQAYAHLGRGDIAGARDAFGAAEYAGASSQRVALELGYLSLAEHDPEIARRHFIAAGSGPDPVLAARAEEQAALLPGHLAAEIYGETFGWSRHRSSVRSRDLVSTVRGRALWRPVLSWDAHLYLAAQATRDVASKGRGSAGVVEIYADNYALFSAGLFARFWQGRAAAFAQLGPAIDLLDDGRERLTFDGRAGLFAGHESAGCGAPGTATGWQLTPCGEGYGEATYVSRFDHNLIGFLRGRAGLTYLRTGPLLWQGLAEVRTATDRNHDYYNNFADVGGAQRFRLTGVVPFDLTVGAHVGRYFGVAGRDPAPARLGYFDWRLVGSTYVGF